LHWSKPQALNPQPGRSLQAHSASALAAQMPAVQQGQRHWRLGCTQVRILLSRTMRQCRGSLGGMQWPWLQGLEGMVAADAVVCGRGKGERGLGDCQRVVIAVMESTSIQTVGVCVHRACVVTLYSGCMSASPLLLCCRPPPPPSHRLHPLLDSRRT
jgi:hypothetical protein